MKQVGKRPVEIGMCPKYFRAVNLLLAGKPGSLPLREQFSARIEKNSFALTLSATTLPPGFPEPGPFLLAHVHPFFAPFAPIFPIRGRSPWAPEAETSEQDAAEHQQAQRLPVGKGARRCHLRQDGVPQQHDDRSQKKECRYKEQEDDNPSAPAETGLEIF